MEAECLSHLAFLIPLAFSTLRVSYANIRQNIYVPFLFPLAFSMLRDTYANIRQNIYVPSNLEPSPKQLSPITNSSNHLLRYKKDDQIEINQLGHLFVIPRLSMVI